MIDLDSNTEITKRQFRELTAYQKGYVVYMMGSRKDQPNVPKDYSYTTAKLQKEYDEGQHAAMIATMDMEE